MKKIILTENQLKKLIQLIKEQENLELPESKYKIKITKPYFYFQDLKYYNHNIDNVTTKNFIINFDLDVKKDISGYYSIKIINIKGPDVLPLQIEAGDNIDRIEISPDWSEEDFIHKELRDTGTVGIHNEIGIYLDNDVDGNIIMNGATIFCREI
jgi:hypothetical protein